MKALFRPPLTGCGSQLQKETDHAGIAVFADYVRTRNDFLGHVHSLTYDLYRGLLGRCDLEMQSGAVKDKNKP